MHKFTGWQSTKTSCAMDTVICIHNMATLFNNISSSKFSANWRATSTYVGLCSTAHVIAVDIISLGTCALTQMASNSQYTLPPKSCPQKKSQEWNRRYTQNEAQKTHHQRISWLLFWMQHLSHYSAIGCLKKKEEEDEQFWLRIFQVCHFDIVTTHCYYYCMQKGADSMSCSMYF